MIYTLSGMRFSIIVPAYNEAEDIAQTLDALISLNWADKEIVVVDDASTDKTPEIVSCYSTQGVKLVRQTKNLGRCEARNAGIREASGEVVVVLNADVQLPSDFLQRLALHYNSGADFVLVESEVANTDTLFPRYIQARHVFSYRNSDTSLVWTEGFSCRRSAALSVGLFRSDLPIPLTSGEDVYFGKQLERQGYRKVMDRSIIVRHTAPHRLKDFCHQRLERGYAVPLALFFLYHVPFPKICLKVLKGCLQTSVYLLTVFPIVWRAYQFSRFSPRGIKDWANFVFAAFIEQVFFTLGFLQAGWNLMRVAKNLR